MLIWLSVFLALASIYSIFIYRRDVLHPGFWTNIGFFGYATGGLYFSAYGYDDALFLNLAGFPDNERSQWFDLSMIVIWLGYLACNAGFWVGGFCFGLRRLSSREAVTNIAKPPVMVLRMALYSSVVFIAVGVGFWLFVANRLAGGLFSLFQNAAAYPHLVSDANLSTLPYHFAYVGIQLWLLAWLGGERKQALGLLFVPLGMLITLSSGRISATGAFGLSALATYLMVMRGSINLKVMAKFFLVLVPLSILYYFFRDFTSYRYIGREDDFSLLVDGGMQSQSNLTPTIDYTISTIFGSGNIPDLQQIVLIISGVSDGKLEYLFGLSYLDWITNFLSIGPTQSVGYRVLNVFFPEKFGGPTPGMIGEAYLNFGHLGFPAVFAMCFTMVYIYKRSFISKSIFVKLLYCKFIISIWSLFVKVDSSLFVGYVWLAVPISLAWFLLYFINAAFSPRGRRVVSQAEGRDAGNREHQQDGGLSWRGAPL